jgi:hypothetical protein
MGVGTLEAGDIMGVGEAGDTPSPASDLPLHEGRRAAPDLLAMVCDIPCLGKGYAIPNSLS